MKKTLVCWRCGASLQELSLPFRRLEQCLKCRADLHVCRMCKSYNPRLTGGCDDPRAQGVRDKELANFCDYFKPSPDAYTPRDDSKSNAAKAELYALFGMQPEDDETDASTGNAPRTEADEARKKLQELFGSSNEKDQSQQ